MSIDLKPLFQLSREEKYLLVEMLLQNLREEELQLDLSSEQIEEAREISRKVKSGEMKTYSWEEVKRSILHR